MKLAPLLSRFLYTHRKLQLAGIGTFLFDGDTGQEATQGKSAVMTGISFENNPGQKDDEELISFISAETGKMKPLATSDLHSFLELAIEFLNIGKPFSIEGIGTLTKIRSGQYDFVPENVLVEKVKMPGMRELASTSSNEESFTGYDDITGKSKKESVIAKKIALPLLLLAGIALAVWGGYTVYKKNADKKAVSKQVQPIAADTDTTKNLSLNKPDSQPAVQQGAYKFVYEITTSKQRAESRYKQVSELNPNIKLETKDSALFKIYIVLPATPADTARIKKELKAWYYGTMPKQVTIEQ